MSVKKKEIIVQVVIMIAQFIALWFGWPLIDAYVSDRDSAFLVQGAFALAVFVGIKSLEKAILRRF